MSATSRGSVLTSRENNFTFGTRKTTKIGLDMKTMGEAFDEDEEILLAV